MRWNDWILLIAVFVMPFVGLRYRRWIARGALTLGAAIFWGAVFAGLVGWALGMLGDARLLLIGLPVSIAIGIIMWKHLPKVLGEQLK